MTNQQRPLFPAAMMRRSKGHMRTMLLVPLLALLALAGSARAQLSATLEGTATYRERIALPPGAVFEAVLQNITQAGKPSNVLGRAIIDPAGQPPFHFKIRYDETAIQPGQSYAVHATVKQQGRLLFTTDRGYRVLAGNDAPLRMMLVSAANLRQPGAIPPLPASYEREVPGANSLIRWHLDLLSGGHYQLRTTYLDKPEPNRFDQIGRWQYDGKRGRLTLYRNDEPPLYFAMKTDGDIPQQLDANGKPIESRLNAPLRRLPEPALIEPRLALTGMFTVMADAASITLCDDGRRLPVAMEADYQALEKTYMNAHPQPGQALLVSVDGLIANRPSQEESQPPRPTLVVEQFKNLWPRETCGQPLTDSSLRGTYWKLVRLNGEPVEVTSKQREPHLIFATDRMRVSGSGGCNRVTGSFTLDGDKLHLGQMAGTMMACPSGMELEQRFLQALTKAERYRIKGSHLELLDKEGQVMARFEAVALR